MVSFLAITVFPTYRDITFVFRARQASHALLERFRTAIPGFRESGVERGKHLPLIGGSKRGSNIGEAAGRRILGVI
jgi:hypothetical protein